MVRDTIPFLTYYSSIRQQAFHMRKRPVIGFHIRKMLQKNGNLPVQCFYMIQIHSQIHAALSGRHLMNDNRCPVLHQAVLQMAASDILPQKPEGPAGQLFLMGIQIRIPDEFTMSM